MQQCYEPYLVKHGDNRIPVPCGRCPVCTSRKVSGWSFRLMQEYKVSRTAYFLTLTYEQPPITKNRFMGLCKRDVQLFIKRLRKAHSGSERGDIRYYCCGEYGSSSYRPHYHIILFNSKLEQLIGEKFATQFYLRYLKLDGAKPFKCPHWDLGHVTVGQVADASVGYTLKYISKPKRIPMHANDDRPKEFALMSKGLGKSYINQASLAWHKDSLLDNMYIPLKDGISIGMPRYFKDKIYSDDERLTLKIHHKLQLEKEALKPIDNVDQIRQAQFAQIRINEIAAQKRNKI